MKARRAWAVCSLTWCFLLNVALAGLFYYLGEQVLLGMKQWVEVLAQARRLCSRGSSVGPCQPGQSRRRNPRVLGTGHLGNDRCGNAFPLGSGFPFRMGVRAKGGRGSRLASPPPDGVPHFLLRGRSRSTGFIEGREFRRGGVTGLGSAGALVARLSKVAPRSKRGC